MPLQDKKESTANTQESSTAAPSELSSMPLGDGVDHINIYSSGATRLGRLLTNFANSPCFYGDTRFASVEGFWYANILACSEYADEVDLRQKPYAELRTAYGSYAKKVGKSICESLGIDTEKRAEITSQKFFKQTIRVAMRSKLDNNQELQHLLKDSTLPLKHYYFYGIKAPYRVILLPQFDWLCDFWEEMREELKEVYR